MIRPDDRELEIVIDIALKMVPNYALRNVFSPMRKFDRGSAVETQTARVVQALRRYEITREAHAHEVAPGTLPLFSGTEFDE